MTKQLVMISTAVMTTLLALLIMWQFRIVIVYVLISVTIAAALRPFIQRLARQGIVARILWILIYLASLVAFGLLVFLAANIITTEVQQLGDRLSVQNGLNLPTWLDSNSLQQVLPALLIVMQTMAGFVSSILVILFLSIYWSLNHTHFERLWLSLLPAEIRKHARDIWRTIESTLGAYIRSEIAQSLLAALLLGVGYWLLGSPYPALLALIGGLAWLMPIIGMILAVILPLLIGLLTSVQLSLVTTLYTLIILIIVEVWVEPLLFRRKWDNPILTLVILLAMADAFGWLGLLAASPLSAVFQILWSLLISNRLTSGTEIQASDLKERLAHVEAAIKELDELPHPLLVNAMKRITELLEKADPILQTVSPDKPSQPLANAEKLATSQSRE